MPRSAERFDVIYGPVGNPSNAREIVYAATMFVGRIPRSEIRSAIAAEEYGPGMISIRFHVLDTAKMFVDLVTDRPPVYGQRAFLANRSLNRLSPLDIIRDTGGSGIGPLHSPLNVIRGQGPSR